MFEVGKKYEIHMVDGEGYSRFWITVEKYEYPLIKTKKKVFDKDIPASEYLKANAVPSEIINVSSAHFVKAIIQDD